MGPLQRDSKITLQILGSGLIIIGVILLVIGTIGLNQVYHCPINGCGPEVESRIFWERVSFYSGIAFIAAGIILLFVARRMKPES